jgi:hypothetical protein
LVYGRREELLQEIRPATLAIAILAIPSGDANLESYSPFAEPSQPVEALVSTSANAGGKPLRWDMFISRKVTLHENGG